MAFGQRSAQSNAQFGPNTKVYFVSIKEKDLEQPYFEIKVKDDTGAYVVVGAIKDKIKYLGGALIGLKNKTFKHEGKDIESTTATFIDKAKDEAYLLTVSQGYLGRNILNSILNLKSFEGLELGLYVSKPKEGQTKGFHSVALRQNGVLIYGKYKMEELPKIVKVKVGKDVHSDASEINAFYTKQIEEFAKVVQAAAPLATVASAPAATAAEAEHVSAEDAAAFNANGDPEDEVTLPGGKKLPF